MVPALQTVPNAGLPSGFRKRIHPNGDEKLSAAGILFLTPDGRGLFVKRAPGSDHAGEYAFPAGRVEQDEEPADAARREALEEIGHLAAWNLAPLHRETSEEGVDFSTFGQPVPEAFDPVLNEEHNEHVWATLDAPPEPLHPGVAKLLAKFFKEEAEEPEHEESGAAEELERDFEAEDDTGAIERLESGIPPKSGAQDIATDSRVRLALDRSSMRRYDQDGRLHIAETNVCKACVSPYRGDEIPEWEELGLEADKIYRMFRPPEELEKATPSINGVQLMRKHIPISADDHQPFDVIGAVGTTARWEDPYVKNGLTIWPAEDIESVENKEKFELSPGYTYRAVMEPGKFEGEPFDGRMVDITFNHLAVVEEGRQGPEICVSDGFDEIYWGALENALLSLRP